MLLFTVMDENKSWLLDQNIQRFCTDPDGAMTKKTDDGFVKSNKMYNINGVCLVTWKVWICALETK